MTENTAVELPFDPNALSLDQIKAAQTALAARERQAAAEHKRAAREKLIALAREDGYEIHDLFGPAQPSAKNRSSSRSSLPAQYANPDNPKQTWVGRGKRPAWVREKLAAGVNLDQLRIQGAA